LSGKTDVTTRFANEQQTSELVNEGGTITMHSRTRQLKKTHSLRTFLNVQNSTGLQTDVLRTVRRRMIHFSLKSSPILKQTSASSHLKYNLPRDNTGAVQLGYFIFGAAQRATSCHSSGEASTSASVPRSPSTR